MTSDEKKTHAKSTAAVSTGLRMMVQLRLLGPQSDMLIGVKALAQLTVLENDQCRRHYYPLHLSIHPNDSIPCLDQSIHGLKGGLSRR